MLEEQYRYKLTIRDLRGDALAETLGRAVRSLSVERTSTDPEVRWGAVFYTPGGDRTAAIFLDVTGTRGFIGSTAVTIRGDFFKWLKDSFAPQL